MVAADHHDKPFDEATLLKLDLFEDYLKSWLGVFSNYNDFTINIVDYFCGPGIDCNGVKGSPLRVIDAIKSFESSLIENRITVNLYLNDISKSKIIHLKNKISKSTLPKCLSCRISCETFDIYFNKHSNLLNHGNRANLLFIDPTGFEINQGKFTCIVRSPKTDFILFIPIQYLYRFQKSPDMERIYPGFSSYTSNDPKILMRNFKKYLKDHFTPNGLEYYLSHFSIKKLTGGHNTCGVIFGSGHIRGLHKFVKECWRKDKINGESNYAFNGDLLDDPLQMTLTGIEVSQKKEQFQTTLTSRILTKELCTNKQIFIWSLMQGFLPYKHAYEEVKKLFESGKIEILNCAKVSDFKLSYDAVIKKEIIRRIEVKNG